MKQLQNRCRKVVENNVICRLDCFVDPMFDAHMISRDDLINASHYVCSACGERDSDCDCRGGVQSEPQNIQEWWSVSTWLYDRLKARGQPVLEYGTHYIWGRCSTGQVTWLDSVIENITEDFYEGIEDDS